MWQTLDLVPGWLFCYGKRYWNHPPCPDTIVITICMSYFTNRDPSREHGTNKPEEFGKGQKDAMYPIASQNPPHWNSSWLCDEYTSRKDPESEWLTRHNLETNPITINSENVSQLAEQFSWAPLPSCFLPGLPFPIKSLAL